MGFDDLFGNKKGSNNKPLKKAPRQLSLENSEGVEKRKKFATSKVLRWGAILYCLFLFRMCVSGSYQPAQNTNQGKTETNYTIEKMLPSSLEHYEARDLEFKTTFTGSEVYKGGIPLGALAQAYVLTDQREEVVGYLNTGGVFNKLGQYTGDVYDGKVYDLEGNEVATLKGDGKNLESIVDGDIELMRAGYTTHVIMAKEPKTKEYKIIGTIDDYEDYLKNKGNYLQ